jgi:hypothetical protein
MWSTPRRRVPTATALAVAATLALPGGAARAQSHDAELPAGQACSFALGIDFGGSGKRVEREFVDAEGNLVRALSAGVGSQLTFTNLSNGETLALRANGAVTQTRFNADGSQTVMTTGHNVLVLFPTDVPAGPSTTLYVGRVVYTVDANQVFTLQSTSGTATNICAALS